MASPNGLRPQESLGVSGIKQMAQIILNLFLHATASFTVFWAFRKKDDKLFFIAWVLSGLMPICMSIGFFCCNPDGKPATPSSAYSGLFWGGLIILISYFLYLKHTWAYYAVRTLCYIEVTVCIIAFPVAYAYMTYRVFAHNAVYPIGRSVVDFNATIEIAFLIFSFKCLDMIRPNLKMKMKREKGKSENEDIECPECNNIIPSNKDHCEICSWSYKKQ